MRQLASRPGGSGPAARGPPPARSPRCCGVGPCIGPLGPAPFVCLHSRAPAAGDPIAQDPSHRVARVWRHLPRRQRSRLWERGPGRGIPRVQGHFLDHSVPAHHPLLGRAAELRLPAEQALRGPPAAPIVWPHRRLFHRPRRARHLQGHRHQVRPLRLLRTHHLLPRLRLHLRRRACRRPAPHHPPALYAAHIPHPGRCVRRCTASAC